MNVNAKATAAYEQAQTGIVTPQIEYATRRIGGKLDGNLAEFTQAYNEAPFVDADLDTNFSPAKILVRPLEPKDGIE